METVEDEFLARGLAFIEKSAKAGKPFFLWQNSTRLHVKTHLGPKWEDKTGYGLAADGMAELDDTVGEILKKLDELKIADNTIVVFTSDNGPEIFTWPDGGNTPFKGEKGTTWEGGFRVPCVVRWPGVIKPGTVINDIMSHEDWLPTFLAAAGDPDVKTKLLTGVQGRRYDLQGPPRRLQLPAVLQGRRGQRPAPRNHVFRRQRESQRPALRRLEDHLQIHGRKFLQRQAGDAEHAVRGQPAPGSLRALSQPSPCSIWRG